jgi:hypothetical protein
VFAVSRAASRLRRFLGTVGRRLDEAVRAWDQRVLGGISLQVGDDPPIPIPSPDLVWRPREGCFVWRHRLSHPEVVSEFRVHRTGRCLLCLRPRRPVFLLPDDELIVRVPGVIHPFGTFTAFPDRCELEVPDRPADAVRLVCLGCGQELAAIEMWVSKRFEGKAYWDACYYKRFGSLGRTSTGKR